MEITKSGLYLSSDYKDISLTIADDIEVYFYDEHENAEEFILGRNSKLFYFSCFMEEGNYKKHFLLSSLDAEVQVKSFLFSRDNTIVSQIIGELQASHTKEDIQIVSFAAENGNIDLDGIVQINAGVKKGEGYLKEENIFLGDSGKIRGIPTLLVRSDDVKASHACNIEKISDEKLFYLRSRGIVKDDAIGMMILSYIEKTFGGLKKVDEELYERVVNNIIVRMS